MLFFFREFESVKIVCQIEFKRNKNYRFLLYSRKSNCYTMENNSFSIFLVNYRIILPLLKFDLSSDRNSFFFFSSPSPERYISLWIYSIFLIPPINSTGLEERHIYENHRASHHFVRECSLDGRLSECTTENDCKKRERQHGKWKVLNWRRKRGIIQSWIIEHC